MSTVQPTRRSMMLGALATSTLTSMVSLGCNAEPVADPLPSWNEGKSKESILNFVRNTTTVGGKHYIPVNERIAVFDNDGTLWCENPLPFELAFAFDRVRELAAQHPEWKTTQPFQAVLENDLPALIASGIKGVMEIVVATHSGMTTEQFNTQVSEWLNTAVHPRFKRPYTEVVYLPMLELLKYLRANEFKTFIVSGGGAAFMRVFADKVYGVPPDQVVGTLFKTKYELLKDQPTLTILPQVSFIDDKSGKPVGIYQAIGIRPVACFGNSDGDYEMLQYTTIGHAPSFGLIVHHTDGVREYAYDAHPKSSGRLIEALAAAPKRGWSVADMKKDWKRVFAFER